ncbi:hypothetical protein BC829DRAFT_386758 [Chytridium lagenaria]|nr:hypothetical protein BC829DRAFT_386758 [Chytridium lagenaria]
MMMFLVDLLSWAKARGSSNATPSPSETIKEIYFIKSYGLKKLTPPIRLTMHEFPCVSHWTYCDGSFSPVSFYGCCFFVMYSDGIHVRMRTLKANLICFLFC